MYYQLVTPASGSILTLAQAKAHLRVDAAVTDWDSYVTSLIGAVESATRAFINRALLTETWAAFASAPDPATNAFIVDLGPNPSISAVAVLRSGAYVAAAVNTDYVTRQMSDDRVLVRPPYGATGIPGAWGTWDVDEQAFKFTFTCGYGAAANVPMAIQQAMLLELGDLYSNRDASRPSNLVENPAAARLLAPFRRAIA